MSDYSYCMGPYATKESAERLIRQEARRLRRLKRPVWGDFAHVQLLCHDSAKRFGFSDDEIRELCGGEIVEVPGEGTPNVRDRGLAADVIADLCQKRAGPVPVGTAVGLVTRELRTDPARAKRLVDNLVADGRLKSVRHRGAFKVIPSLFGWDGWGER